MPQNVDRNGCSLAYEIRGNGPRVLFIQGVGVQGAGWRPQVEPLASRFNCLTFDNRGIGRSQAVGKTVTVEQMAEDARAVLDAAGWQAAHVVGHSLGGLVAQYLALNHRDRVRSLSLLCTFASGRAAAPLTARMIWYGLRTKLGTKAMRRRGFMKFLTPPGAAAALSALEVAELFGHNLVDLPAVVPLQLKAMRAADATPRLGELAGLPTLVVSAAHDPLAPPVLGCAIAAGIPRARYQEFPDASHGLPITHAAEVNALLDDHWQATER